MIKNKSEKPVTTFEIDLTGPEGNSFALMGYAERLGKQLGLDVEPIISDMMSGDYNHLLEVFEKHLGEHVILYR